MDFDIDDIEDEEELDENADNIFFHRDFEKAVLSVFWRSGKLGAAAYFVETAEVLNDIADVRPYFQICQHLLREIKPTTVICSKTLSPVFIDRVQNLITDLNADENVSERKIKLNTIPSKYFKYDQCKILVSKMNLVNQMENLMEENRWCFLQTLVNFNYKMMISALGALLHFLDTYVSKIVLHIPSLHILSVKSLNLDSLVWMDQESYKALEIFAPSSNYSSLNKWSRECTNRDSFCLHSIFNRCHSSLGTQYMRVLLSHPTKDIAKLRNRHEIIEFFLKAENQVTLKTLQECLKNIRNISTVILRITGTQATPSQWKTFYTTIHNAVVIGEICRSHSVEVTLFREIGDTLEDSLYIMSQLIEMLMDFKESENMGRFTVKNGAVPELDEIKEKYKDLPNIMESVAEMELENLPDQIESCSLVYMPEIGYLLAVPAWHNTVSEKDLMLDGMEFKFVLNNVVHYKSARCEEMDSTIGDSHLIILKHETEIMYQIVSYIQDHIEPITAMLEKVKLLDCLIAFSSVAREYDMAKPNLTNDQVINIENGRHLLTQQRVSSFIPNDFKSSLQDSLIKIFTGPNSSGKSVYLKQVALTVYLAHVGSFVPAEKATIGVVDYIHTRIQTTESIATQLSSFTLDLRQMYSSIYNSTPNTLIVVDEFGKGTADLDGLALLYAYIQQFTDRNDYCPHILISTHFQSIISLLPESPLIKPQTFEFVIENNSITYLYKIKDGSVNSSFAHMAACCVGFSKRIMSRADEILKIMQSDGLEPKAQEDNARTTLVQWRTRCLAEVVKKIDDQTKYGYEVDLQDIISMLNNVRF